MATPLVPPIVNIGEMIGDFRIIDFLGAGGMGEVYQAVDLRLERMVALKIIDPNAGAEAIARFRREGKAAAALQHPNIVTVYGVGEHPHTAGNLYYIAMEFIDGTSLRRELSRPLTITRILEWMEQVADGLAAAHRAKVVHRDLKPENIMITADGRAKIVDFGLAKYEVPSGSDEGVLATNAVSRKGEILGTFHYMSPEQASERPVDHRSDIFSVGTILYEATERRLPFLGPNAADVLREIMDRDPEISSTGPVREIITRCLAKDPRKRYQDAREIVTAIAAILRGPVTIDTIPVMARPPSRRSWRIAAAVAVIALVSGCLWTWDHHRLKVAYFAHISTQWGVPVGVGQLDGKLRLARQTSFRFEMRRNKVRRIVRVNSADQVAADEESDQWPEIQVIAYREDGTVQQIDHRDRNEKLVMRMTFSVPRETDEGVLQYVDFHAEHRDEPLALSGAGLGVMNPAAASEITAHQLLYDSNGRTARVMYLNAYRQNRPNAARIFGERLIYQTSSLLRSSVESLDPAGVPAAGSNGLMRIVFHRNSRGDVLEERQTGIRGEPILGTSGCHRIARVLDANGNMREFSCFGVDNEPVLYSHGFHKSTQDFDARGNMIAWAHFGIDDKPVLNADGVHSCKRRFDSSCRSIEWAYFGVDGKPLLHNDGYHKGTQVADKRGNVVERAYFGLDGKPIVDIDHVHRERFRLDARGNVVETAFFGVDAKPTLSRGGVHMIKSRFDPRDRLTRQVFLGVDGKPAMSESSFHRIALAHDSRGNVIDEAYFGMDDKPVLTASGVHRFTRSFDAGGNLTAIEYFGTDGKPITVKGHHRYTCVYDHRLNRSEFAFYGTDGKPALSDLGYHKAVTLHDSRGNQVEEAFYGPDGTSCVNREGYHKRTFTVDAVGNAIETAHFALDGTPAVNGDGIHLIKSQYDIRHHPTEQAVFGVDGRPAVDRDGVHRTIWHVDFRGEIVEIATFGTNDQPKSGANWIAFAWGAMKDHEAQFVQKFTPAGFEQPQIERGVVVFGGLSQMRWTYETPETKLFIFSYNRSWLYLEAEATVTISDLTEATREALPFVFFDDPERLRANYAISDERSGHTETTHLRAKHSGIRIPKVTVDRDVRDNLIRRIEYVDRSGNRMVFELTTFKPTKASAELFEFRPPPGVQVIHVQ